MSNAAEIRLDQERLADCRNRYDYRRAKFDHYNANVKRSQDMHHPVARKLAEVLRAKWARSMGEAAKEVNKYVRRLHELVPPETAVEHKERQLAAEHPETHDPIRKVVAKILVSNPRMYVTATTGGHHAAHSYHFLGRAYDLGADSQDAKDGCGQWCNEHVASSLTEGIHNGVSHGDLSVENGQRVPSSFWGSVTWAGHVDHVHVAV